MASVSQDCGGYFALKSLLLNHLACTTPVSHSEISKAAAPWDKERSRPYLTLLTVSSKLENHIQQNNKKEPEPLADKPAWGVIW